MTDIPNSEPFGRRFAGLQVTRERAPALVWGVAICAALGFAARFYAAGGALTNDEMWSLLNLRPLSSIWQVLYAISHDNNHFLNSLWLYAVFPLTDVSCWLRAPSILAGTLTIPVMAWWGARRSSVCAAAAAALTAGSYFELVYSTEARGYAMALLAITIAAAALERAMDRPAGRARFLLAAAAGLGAFSHLGVAPAVALMAIAAFLENARRAGGLTSGLVATWRIFWPSALAMAPTVACVAAGIVSRGGFTIGYTRPYATSHVIAALAQLEMMTFGFDLTSKPQIVFAIIVAPVLLALAIGFVALKTRRIIYATVFVFPVLAVFSLHPANSHAARYFFPLAPFLLMLAAEAFDAGWKRSGVLRALALAGLTAALLANGASYARYLSSKSPNWSDALDTIAASPGPALSSSFDFNVGRLVEFYNWRRGATLELAPPERLCAARPPWRVVELTGVDMPPERIEVDGGSCWLGFTLYQTYGRFGPSQGAWALYRSDVPPR